ncbi:transposase [Pelagicoccus sp. SDUM812003]|uniref:transposase n=1 Tax=Pelagicoccus sp. SDUM812003 TaxID=3041267 RepID=UPI00280DFDCD|nr:transposase [Pelagicoccus sp. SDUM812003]MDQ8205689.1 transposase [Pelagicoccus sp. SDUM812003]
MESKYPKRLCHAVPGWVKDGAVFHIRIRVQREWSGSLIAEGIGEGLLESVAFNHAKGIWYCRVFMLMPDHVHALLSFDPCRSMSEVIGNWKSYTAKRFGVSWQSNYFDHRIRHDASLDGKREYVLNNPLAKELCERWEDWKWRWLPDE